MLRRLAVLSVLLSLAAGAVRAADAPPGLDRALDAILDRGAPGVSLLVYREGTLLYRLDRGDLAPDARLPVASASKWMTAALVMTVVDEGLLSLD
ncbi:MAG: serine hydrolase, partial [Alphaproteobacteria bacterium]